MPSFCIIVTVCTHSDTFRARPSVQNKGLSRGGWCVDTSEASRGRLKASNNRFVGTHSALRYILAVDFSGDFTPELPRDLPDSWSFLRASEISGGTPSGRFMVLHIFDNSQSFNAAAIRHARAWVYIYLLAHNILTTF